MSDEHYGILIESDRDRRTLAWLRRIKTDDEIAAAAMAVATSGRRVYVSNVVRHLGLTEVAKQAHLDREPPSAEQMKAREREAQEKMERSRQKVAVLRERLQLPQRNKDAAG